MSNHYSTESTLVQKSHYLRVNLTGKMTPSALYDINEANQNPDDDRLVDLSNAIIDINLIEYQRFLERLLNSDHNRRRPCKVAILFSGGKDSTFAQLARS